jgi:hypothetical protein
MFKGCKMKDLLAVLSVLAGRLDLGDRLALEGHSDLASADRLASALALHF